MKTLTDLSRQLGPFLASTVNTFFKNAPVSSNAVCSILLFIIKKLVQMDFACPCGADCHILFVVLLFIIPGVVAFVLVTAFQTWEFRCQECRTNEICACCWKCCLSCLKKICVCIFPMAVWGTLLLLDGRYYTCIKTDWLGQYVTVNHSVLEKWCEPDDRTLNQESLKKSYDWYTRSQSYGLILLGVLAIWARIIIKVESQPSKSGGPSAAAEGNGNVGLKVHKYSKSRSM